MKQREHLRTSVKGKRFMVNKGIKRYKPMRPKMLDKLPSGDNIIYSPKYDGSRILFYDTGKTELITRRNNDLIGMFPD